MYYCNASVMNNKAHPLIIRKRHFMLDTNSLFSLIEKIHRFANDSALEDFKLQGVISQWLSRDLTDR